MVPLSLVPSSLSKLSKKEVVAEVINRAVKCALTLHL